MCWFTSIIHELFPNNFNKIKKNLNNFCQFIPKFPNLLNFSNTGIFSTSKSGTTITCLKTGKEFRSSFKIMRFFFWIIARDHPEFLWLLDNDFYFTQLYAKAHLKRLSESKVFFFSKFFCHILDKRVGR